MGSRIRHLRVLVDTEELPFPKGCVVEVLGNLSTDPIRLYGPHWAGVWVDFHLSAKDYRRMRGFVFRAEVVAPVEGATC